MDYPVHGIPQARILEWAAFPFSRWSSQPRDWAQVSRIAGGFLTAWATDSMDMSLSELREMVTDREAWRAVIHGVAKSGTRLSDWTELNWTDESFSCRKKSGLPQLPFLLPPNLSKESFFPVSGKGVSSLRLTSHLWVHIICPVSAETLLIHQAALPAISLVYSSSLDFSYQTLNFCPALDRVSMLLLFSL